MVTVAEMRRRFDTVGITELTADAMEQNADEVVEFNREQMNEKGVDKTGRQIRPKYTPFTVSVKRQKGQPFDRVTLRDTGEFQSRMHLQIQRDTFGISSDDYKTSSLVEKYGEDIFGLTSESKRQAWNDFLASGVVNSIKKITGAI